MIDCWCEHALALLNTLNSGGIRCNVCGKPNVKESRIRAVPLGESLLAVRRNAGLRGVARRLSARAKKRG
jgi:hypothetical protein